MLATLDAVKTLLQITHNEDDDFITSLIAASSTFAETYCNTKLMKRHLKEIYMGSNSNTLLVNAKPIFNVISLKVNQREIKAYNQTNHYGYTFHNQRIALINEKFMQSDLIEVEFESGYDENDAPSDLSWAIAYNSAELYRNRDRLGISSESLANGGTVSYQSLMHPKVEHVLKNYKKVHQKVPVYSEEL